MLALLLATLLVLPSPTPVPFDGGPSSDDTLATAPPSTATLTPAPRGPASFPSWNVALPAQRRATVWVNAGYGVVDQDYTDSGGIEELGDSFKTPFTDPASGEPVRDQDGNVVLYDARISGEVAVFNLHVGGSYDVMVRPTYSVTAGLDLGFSSQHFQAEEAVIFLNPGRIGQATDQEIESGFKAQSVTVFGEVKNRWIAGRVGYQLDVGPAPNRAEGERENSDRQDAFMLAVDAHRPLGSFRVFGGAAAYLTLDGEEGGLTYDEGDHYGVHVGSGYRFGFGEVGLAASLRVRTDGDNIGVVRGQGQVFLNASDAGFQFAFEPYLNIAPPGADWTMYVKGAVQDEYRDYPFSVAGSNEFVTQKGATVGLLYAF